MPNIKVSSGVPEDTFLELRFVLRYLAQKLSSKGVEFVLTRLQEEVAPFSGSSVYIYGFSDSDQDEWVKISRLVKHLKNQFAIPVILVKSSCFSVGEKEESFPYLQIMCGPRDDYLKLIKTLKLGYDAEFHLVNSNILPDDLSNSYVEIILTPNEAQLFGRIIEEFGKTSLSNESIWPKLIMRFVSRDELG